jgi:hypothetical protein
MEGVRLESRLKKGGGYLFLSWEKKIVEESNVKRSILTTFVAMQNSKTPNLDLSLSLELF